MACCAARGRAVAPRPAAPRLAASELRRQAIQLGVSDQALDEAADASDPRAALFALVASRQAAEATRQAQKLTAARKALAPLRASELRQRATELGVSDRAIDDADDGDNPRAALIDLILEKEEEEAEPAAEAARAGSGGQSDGQAEAAQAAADAVLRAELIPLRLSDLKRRAAASGAAAEDIEDIDNEDDPREAAIGLIIGGAEARKRVSLEEAEEEDDVTLRNELTSMRMGTLRKRALADGVPKDAVEDADDDEHPKAALVRLVLARAAAGQVATAEEEQQRAQLRAAHDLRIALMAMKMGALRKRALADGVSEDAVDEAVDTEVPREGLIELVLEQQRRKSAPSNPNGGAREDEAIVALEAELQGLRISQLTTRCQNAGIDEALLHGAQDSDNAKAALIGLLTEASRGHAASPEDKERESEQLAALLRAELQVTRQ